MKVSTWSLVLGRLLQYGPNWNWLCDRREILESCRATAASLYIPRRPENTVERKVSALVFPKAAAVAAQVTVECEVTAPLLAGTVIVIRETDHRASIISALDRRSHMSAEDQKAARRLET